MLIRKKKHKNLHIPHQLTDYYYHLVVKLINYRAWSHFPS